MFGDTAVGIVVLDFILVAMGMVLTPILWGIYKRLGDNLENSKDSLELLAHSNATLAKVVEELHNARVRDKELEGRIKGLDDKVNRHLQPL